MELFYLVMKSKIILVCYGYGFYNSRRYFIKEEELLESHDMISWGPINLNELKRFKEKLIFTWEL